MPDYFNTDVWQYCGKCGGPVVKVREWGIGKFSSVTGQEYSKVIYRCDKKLWPWDGHTQLVMDNAPKGYS